VLVVQDWAKRGQSCKSTEALPKALLPVLHRITIVHHRLPLRPPTHRAFLVWALRLRKEGARSNLPYAAVGVFEAYYVFLVELSEGNLQNPHRLISHCGEAVDGSMGEEDLLLRLRVKYLVTQLHAGSLVQNHPQLVPLEVILAGKYPAGGGDYYLYRRFLIVGVLFKLPPGFLHLNRLRCVVEHRCPFLVQGLHQKLTVPDGRCTCG